MANKKSQMKIQQTAFMLLGVTLFFALVGMAFVGLKLSGMKGEANDLKKQNAQLLVSKLANSPEFSCGDSFYTSKSNCIDADKVMALKAQEVKYSGFWGTSNIEIRRIYPKTNGEVNCTKTNYPNCNIIALHAGRVGTYEENFVILCRKEAKNGVSYDKCEMAKLMVSFENVN
ncbi:MAG TPA: hypothetical protein VJH92_00290 [Candidatus Nanoarchaeia archaeon]|nr:hypothetical protein [Candidatus Nanoarchaeia archaeon]